MNEKTSIRQNTGLRHHLTPQQVQFVKILEMNSDELDDEVRRALDENPALETVTPDESAESERFDETSDELQRGDYGDPDDVPDYLQHPRRRGGYAETMAGEFFDPGDGGVSLLDSLEQQLDFVDASERDVNLARYLVGMLDDNGRMSRSLNDIAADISESTGADVTRSDLLGAMNIIKYQLDPPGLGASDLRECLLIQLRRIEKNTLATRTAAEIIENYFDMFERKHFDRLPKALGVDRAVVDDALAVINGLDPRPGASGTDVFADRVQHITPDFIVRAVEGYNDRFAVSLNQRIPELAIEETFRVDPTDNESRKFVKHYRDEANTFIGLLRRRSDTLLTVIKAIVAIQQQFFRTEDMTALRPMILKDVSAATGLDKSVISRATANKYLATERRTYPVSMFFNDTPTDDSDVSKAEIQSALRQLVENEDKTDPLSDQAITDALQSQGYDVARRTVAKYREGLNIPVKRLRKQR